ncbi:hypothetical protein [Streptomyces sp. NPDC056817]|uniref:hypothetical protein n=1 Tax=Streptomyces sp. NPDC056817 TaxID=3345950 RepID=UPI0036929D44
MDLEDADTRARFLIRDRDGKFPAVFDAVLKDASVEVVLKDASVDVVLTGVRMPRMNSIMESGTSGICSTPYASSRTSTIRTAPTKASPTPDQCGRYRRR